jgi:hypothetical protein
MRAFHIGGQYLRGVIGRNNDIRGSLLAAPKIKRIDARASVIADTIENTERIFEYLEHMSSAISDLPAIVGRFVFPRLYSCI